MSILVKLAPALLALAMLMAPAIVSAQPTITLTIDDAEAAEAGQATASLSILRAGGDTGASLAVYLTISGSATAGTDYSMSGVNWLGGQSYYVVLSAAQLSLSLTLTPFPDNAAEGTETVTVALVAAPDPNAYIVGTLEPGELTIADDVAEVTLAIDDAEAAEAGQATASLSISRAGGDTGASLAVYLTISGSATAGSDYSMSGVNWLGGQSYYVVLSAAQLSLSLTLTPFPDNAAEGTEMVTAILAAAQGPPHDYTLGAVSMGELTIADDVAKVTLAIDDAVAAETDQSTASLSILRAGGDTGASLVVYLTIGGSATGGSDYSMPGVNGLGGQNYYVVMGQGQSSHGVTVTPAFDLAEEGDETVEFTLLAAQSAGHDYTIGTPFEGQISILDHIEQLFKDGFEVLVTE